MKNYINFLPLLFASIILAITSSSCDVSNDGRFTDTYTYKIQRESVIVVDSVDRPAGEDSTITTASFSVEPGNNTVFTYTHNRNSPDGIADAGLAETLIFQVPEGTVEFEFQGEELRQATALYKRSCYCALSGAALEVTTGTIRGEQLSAIHWIIFADVTIESAIGTFDVAFEQPFYVN
ncbi:MAG: hypothetical protein JXR26_08540 [Balneolaceae bacterium]|nr:hypothetical protein [Balneolaceae bacterium]